MQSIFRTSVVALLFVFVTALSAPQAAAAKRGIYFGLSGGLNLDLDVKGTDPALGTAKFEISPGFVVAATLGFDFAPKHPALPMIAPRVELEVNYRANDFDQVSVSGVGVAPSSGKVRAFSGLANIFFDFHVRGKITPYVGGGIGVATGRVEDLAVAGVPIGSGSATSFAWQVGAGFAYELREDVDLTVDYRFFDDLSDLAPGFGNALRSHSFMVGLRWHF